MSHNLHRFIDASSVTPPNGISHRNYAPFPGGFDIDFTFCIAIPYLYITQFTRDGLDRAILHDVRRRHQRRLV
jgi:hypothetical protein